MILKELKLLLRDRHSLIVLFLMPVLLILVISLALQDVHAKLNSSKLSLEIHDLDQSEESHAITKFLISHLGHEQQHKKKQVIINIPKGFTHFGQAHLEEKETSIFPVSYHIDPSLDAVYRQLVQSTLILGLQKLILDEWQRQEDDRQKNDFFNTLDFSSQEPPTQNKTEKLSSEARVSQWIKSSQNDLRPIPTPLQQTVPAWTLFAMFFIALPLSNSLMQERKNGLLMRLRTYPISIFRIVSGKLIPYFMINIIQAGLMLTFGFAAAPLLGLPALELGSHPWTLLPLFISIAMASTSYGIMISSACKSYEQASAIGAFSVVIMAMLGGLMVPTFIMPELMQTIAKVSPLYWALEGTHRVFLYDGGMTETLPYMMAMLLWSSLFLLVGQLRFRWD